MCYSRGVSHYHRINDKLSITDVSLYCMIVKSTQVFLMLPSHFILKLPYHAGPVITAAMHQNCDPEYQELVPLFHHFKLICFC